MKELDNKRESQEQQYEYEAQEALEHLASLTNKLDYRKMTADQRL